MLEIKLRRYLDITKQVSDGSEERVVGFVLLLLLLLVPVGGILLVRHALSAKQGARVDGIDCEDAGDLSQTVIFSSPNRSKTTRYIVSIFWWLSLLSYLIALAMPFNFFGEMPGGGIGALLIGWIYFFFWLPNPFYLCGLIYLKKKHWNKAILFAIGAVAISGYWIIDNPVLHPHTFLEWSGPIAFVWFGSFCLLLFASFWAWATIPVKHHYLNTTRSNNQVESNKGEYGNEINY